MTEPRVLSADVRAVLRAIIRPDDPDEGEAVQILAERAGVSTRTVYRHLDDDTPDMVDGTHRTTSLAMADALLTAAGRTLAEAGVRVLVDGEPVEYLDA